MRMINCNYWFNCSFSLTKIRMHKRMSPHGDYDHMGEAINLVENFKVEKVILTVVNLMN